MRKPIRVITNAIRPVRREALNATLTNGGKFRVVKLGDGYAPAVQPASGKIVVLNTNRYNKLRDAMNEIRAKYEQTATQYAPSKSAS